MVVSSRRVGVEGFEGPGELYVKRRFLEGVDGAVGAFEEEWLEPAVRTGDDGRASGGVTSV